MKGKKQCLLLKYYGDYMKKQNNYTRQEYIDTTMHNWKTNVEIKLIKGKKKKLTLYTPSEIKDNTIIKNIVFNHVGENMDSFKFESIKVISK